MESVNKRTLNKLIEFLEPSKDASDTLEEEKRPTLLLVVLYASTLKNHLEHAPVSAVEAVEIEKIKACARRFLDMKLNSFSPPQDCHISLASVPPTPHVAEDDYLPMSLKPQDEDETDDDIRDPASKTRCLEDDNVATDELEEYLHGKDYSCSGVFELCDFWRAHDKEFPKLARSERNLSVAGYVMQARRTCLKKE
ncbi:hypothetical protein HPB47_000949 [Ixodes persulcatus]|uniref:Uncharacterized protein n=1 Tax=Ixodes persulcatus TaxID=34615 RepID=A0AC60PQM0_IXOPE|nr:hypothetical protein HPB47_000949 [Ixodes persulcatus]